MEKNDAINKLVYINCPFCGALFKIPARPGFEGVYAKKVVGLLEIVENTNCACPKCQQSFYAIWE